MRTVKLRWVKHPIVLDVRIAQGTCEYRIRKQDGYWAEVRAIAGQPGRMYNLGWSPTLAIAKTHCQAVDDHYQKRQR